MYQVFYQYNIVCRLGLVLGLAILCGSCKDKPSIDPWKAMDDIVAQTTVPTFLDNTYNIVDYGAVADGQTDNTAAIAQAIAECSKNGGGKVLVPQGKFLSAPIHLQDNVNLHLAKGAEILFSKNLDDYPMVPTSYEGTELINFSPLVYANNKKNIAITGSGILNGQAGTDNWWPWAGKEIYGYKPGDPKQHSSLAKLKEGMSEKGVPVSERTFGKGEYLRPTFIESYECTNVLIEGVTIINAPFWVIHPFRSTNVTVSGVTVESHGPNNDGCDPEYSKNVVIKNCVFNTGDDCIAIKSGRNEDGRRVNIPSENIVVQGCKMKDGHGGVVIGSEISAGVRNVYVSDCQMDSPNLDRAIRIKTNTKRGGVIENVYVRNLQIGQVKEAVLKINLFYGTYANQTGTHTPIVKNINLQDIEVQRGGKYGILAQGHDTIPITDIRLKNVTINQVDSLYSLKGVRGLVLENTKINGQLIALNKK